MRAIENETASRAREKALEFGGAWLEWDGSWLEMGSASRDLGRYASDRCLLCGRERRGKERKIKPIRNGERGERERGARWERILKGREGQENWREGKRRSVGEKVREREKAA
ncbi:hypothetical protein Tco_0913113 [Tanacetum coccineum]